MGQKILHTRAILKIEDICAAAAHLFGRKPKIEQQAGFLAGQALMGGFQLQMAFLARSRHRPRHLEYAAQKGCDTAVLLEHISVEMIGDMAFPVIAERIKNTADLCRFRECKLCLAPDALRLAHNKKRALQQRLQAARNDFVFSGKSDLLMGKHRGVQQGAVCFRTRAARPLHGNAA